jgi:hypothetical protein
MGIKETWVLTLRLYRKSLPQTWHLGVGIGITVVTAVFISALYKTNMAVPKIIGLVTIPILLICLYLSSLVFLKVYDIKNERSTSWKDSLDFVNKRYLKIFVSMLLVNILSSLGTFVLILPGIFLFILLSMTQPLVLLDNKGIIEGIKESCKLVWGNWRHIFAVIIPLAFINYWISISVIYATIYAKWPMVISSGFIAILFYPLLYTCFLVLFDDLKSRKT